MLSNLNTIIQPIAQQIHDFKQLDCELPEAFKASVSKIGNNRIEYGKYNACATNTYGQRIFISNSWFYIASILSPLYKPFTEYKSQLWEAVPKDILKAKDKERIIEAIKDSEKVDEEDKEFLIKFATEPQWWNGGNSTDGKSLDRGDCLNSAILAIANVVNVSQGYIVDLWEFLGQNKDIAKLLNAESADSMRICTTPKQQIFFGSPGTGKSFKVNKLIMGSDTPEDCIFRTTFHPDSDYASFVGSYKPTKEGDELTYEFIPQTFTDAYVKAWQSPEEKVFLVIEEINRGNCAQIFGDLFQLLDRGRDGKSEYQIKADAELRKYLESDKGLGAGHDGIKDGKLSLPSNLYILATMNTSDQSLFPMDSAFKRRWTWEYVPVNTECPDSQFKITIGENENEKTYKWSSFLKIANERIHKLSDSEDKQMGNFFIKSDIHADEFRSKVMFYLWSEVCKEYESCGSFFKYRKQDGSEAEFTFNSLFPDGNETDTILQGFMAYLGVEPDK